MLQEREYYPVGADRPERTEARVVAATHRELENCLTRALVLTSGDVIRPEHVSLTPESPGAMGLLRSLAEVEREHVERVYAATGGHKSRTAEILGISRPRLDPLLERYEAEGPAASAPDG